MRPRGSRRVNLPESAIPWADLPQRWGHPWHSMSSYLGTFPAALARSMITLLSDPGDVVLDPFAGRGTTLLEARLTGRIPLSSDLNPIALALTRAKNASVQLEEVVRRIDDLEEKYDFLLYLPEASVQATDILLIYHPRVLAQLCYLKRVLLPRSTETDELLIGAVLGIMHGAERQDGSSAYASISMPNTFSMSPDYVRRFVQTNHLQRVNRNVFQILREKVQRLFREAVEFPTRGIVTRADAKRLSDSPEFADYIGRVDLVVTSPPYLGVVNYARQNWIRSWFLDEDPEDVSGDLDDNLPLAAWLDFVEQSVNEIRKMLRPGGTAVLVIGDVAKPNKSVVSLAREFLRRVIHQETFGYVGCLSDRIQTEVKTTRIWKDTKGKATAVDRVVILSDAVPQLRWERLGTELLGDPSVQLPAFHAEELAEYAFAFAG